MPVRYQMSLLAKDEHFARVEGLDYLKRVYNVRKNEHLVNQPLFGSTERRRLPAKWEGVKVQRCERGKWKEIQGVH